MTSSATGRPSSRLRNRSHAWVDAWNRVGSQAQFYSQTLLSVGDTVVKHETEMMRQIAQMSLGTGALAIIGGTIVIVGFLTLSTGALIAVQGYNQFADVGVEAAQRDALSG